MACTTKNIMIVNYATSWSITLESSITLLELSIMLLENLYSTGITHDYCNMFIVEATGWQNSGKTEELSIVYDRVSKNNSRHQLPMEQAFLKLLTTVLIPIFTLTERYLGPVL